jgi:uncharacterized protein YndB with AHSA1/START domain
VAAYFWTFLEVGMKWVQRILGGLVGLCVLAIAGLWLAGLRPGHGRLVAEVVIDRPPTQVFRWLTEDERVKKWIAGLEEVRPISAPADESEVGKKFHMVEVYKGERVEMEMVVTKFENDRALSILVTSVGDPTTGFAETGDYTLAEQASKTRLRFDVQAKYFGFLPRLLEPMITPEANAKLQEDFRRLKALVEAEPLTVTNPISPSAEIERLSFMLGDWSYSEDYAKSTLAPKGGQNFGTWKATIAPDGVAIDHRFELKGAEPYRGREIMAWDQKVKRYRDEAFDQDSNTPWTMFLGKFDGATLVYHGEFDLYGKHVKYRGEIRPRSGGGFTLDEFGNINGEKEELILRGRTGSKLTSVVRHK